MKTIIQKTIRFGIPVAMIMVGMLITAQPAFASYAFNGRSEDCDTASVMNRTTNQGYAQPCWSGKAISATVGQEFTVKVYARNTGDTAASNVSVAMTQIDGATVSGTQTYSARVLVNGTAVAGENVTVTFPSTNVKIQLVTIELEKYSNARSTGITNLSATSSLFSPSGLLVYQPSMPADLATWITAKATYKVVAIDGGCTTDCGGTGSAPEVITGGYSPWSETNGTATLQGEAKPNGAATCTYFNYQNTNNSYVSTTPERCGITQTAGRFNIQSEYISGLSTGTYKYQACGRNSYGSDCGEYKFFTITRNVIVDPGTSDLSVTTGSYSWINQNTGSITLNGSYYGNNGSSARTYFQYRRNGENTRNIGSGSFADTSRSFNVSLYDLDNGSYEYQACTENNRENECGSWKQFEVYKNTYQNNNYSTIQTLSVLFRGQDFATLDGYLNLQGCSSAQTYFQYGRSSGYGSTTAYVTKTSSGSISQGITGLAANTTYYYQAVAQVCGTTIYGSQQQFTTYPYTVVNNNNGGGTTTIIRNITTTANTNIGGGAQYIRLTIDNGRDTIVKGDDLIYDVQWENISKTDLKDLVLEVSFPEGLQITSTDKGQVDRKANTVYVNIRELEKLEKDDMTIRARVTGTFKDNDPITARAIIAFENPVNKAQENAIAYDSDSFLASTNVLGASIFGLDFLPGTLAGWLFIILLLILVILIIRYTTRREEHHHYYQKDEMNPAPAAPRASAPMPPIAHTSTEVDYTPYRPTPRA